MRTFGGEGIICGQLDRNYVVSRILEDSAFPGASDVVTTRPLRTYADCS